MSSSRATLYTFSQSVWASLPDIMLHEKGYSENDIVRKEVNLRKGEQYLKSYLNINSNGWVPTLVVPVRKGGEAAGATEYQAIVGSVPIIEFLDKSRGRDGLTAVSEGAAEGPSDDYGGTAPTVAQTASAPLSSGGVSVLSPATIASKSESDELIKVLQSADGNMLLFGFRNLQERDFKKEIFQQSFRERLETLLNCLDEAKAESEPSAQARVAFYEKTLEQYAPLAASYDALPPSLSTSQGREASHNRDTATHLIVQNIEKEYVKLGNMFNLLESMVKLPFALGDQFSIADVVAMAVLARFAFIAKLSRAAASGKSPETDGEPVTSFVGLPASVIVGPRVQVYTAHLMSRQSFKAVYVNGLH